jgi:hypothetical protein
MNKHEEGYTEWKRQTLALARGCAQLAMFAETHDGAKGYAAAALKYWREVETQRPDTEMLEDLGLTDALVPTQPMGKVPTLTRGSVAQLRVPYETVLRWMRAGARAELRTEVPVSCPMRLVYTDNASAPFEVDFSWSA